MRVLLGFILTLLFIQVGFAKDELSKAFCSVKTHSHKDSSNCVSTGDFPQTTDLKQVNYKVEYILDSSKRDPLPIMQEIIEIYNDHYKDEEKSIKLEYHRDSTKLGIYAKQNLKKKELIFIAHQGFLDYPGQTKETLMMAFCHELGHFFGGAPYVEEKKINGSALMNNLIRQKSTDELSAEGQADYFAAKECMKDFFKKNLEDYTSFIKTNDLEKENDICSKSFSETKDLEICSLILDTSEKLAMIYSSIIKELTGQEVTASLDKKETTKAQKTLTIKGEYPSLQCRLDTMVSGALCSNEIGKEACQGDQKGRPSCWFVDPNPIKDEIQQDKTEESSTSPDQVLKLEDQKEETPTQEKIIEEAAIQNTRTEEIAVEDNKETPKPVVVLHPNQIKIDQPEVNLSEEKRDRSDLAAMMKNMTSVKDQQGMQTCSSFAAAAYLEYFLVKEGHFSKDEADLSEEWINYLYISTRGKQKEGTNAGVNLKLVTKYGVPLEESYRYVPELWLGSWISNLEAIKNCEHLEKNEIKLNTCLIAHRDPDFLNMSSISLSEKDPDFLKARNEARDIKAKHIKKLTNNKRGSLINNLVSNERPLEIFSRGEVKNELLKDKPIILDVDLFYNAWNHHYGKKHDIKVDSRLFENGIVTYPEEGTKYQKASVDNKVGHAVLIVGYDADRIIKYEHKMPDGTKKEFSRKGVYYFKNSWGTSLFGKNFTVDGVNYPGYGMIPIDYAHDHGNFYLLDTVN